MKRKAQVKQYIIRENTIQTPDGFGMWYVVNIGTTTAILNDTLPVPPGREFGLDIHPDVIWDSNISIKFIGEGTNSLVFFGIHIKNDAND